MATHAASKAKRTGKPPDRRQQIVDAAIELFLRKGVAGTSMRDLAAAVGMKAGSLYNHFRSKDEIVDNVVERGSKSIQKLRAYREGLGQSSATETLRECVKCWILQAEHDRDRIILLNREPPSANPARQRQIVDTAVRDVRDLTDFFGAILEEGVTSGEFSPIDINLTIFNIWMLKIEWALRSWWPTRERDVETYARKQADIIIRQISAGGRASIKPGIESYWTAPTSTAVRKKGTRRRSQ